MSVQFDVKTLTSFADRAKDIDLGAEVIELGDDMGMNLLANQNKVAASPKRQVSFTPQTDAPNIQLKPVDDLEVVNLDTVPGSGEIRIQKSNDIPFVLSPEPVEIKPKEDDSRVKQEYLIKLSRLDAREVGGQRMTMMNSVDEIRAEVDRRTDSRNLEASLRFQRNALMTFVTGVEMVNEKFGSRLPVKPKLKGWSESVHTNVEDFDEIFEELYDMYKDKAKMHPLLRLAGTLGVSATMYHLTNTMAERTGIPGMADILNEDPELQRQFAQKIASKMGGGMGNFMSAAMAATPRASPPSPPARFPAEESTVPKVRREMRGPSGVDDILRAFEAERSQPVDNPIQSSHAGIFSQGPPPSPPADVHVQRNSDPMLAFMMESDGQSVGSVSTMNTERRRGRKRTQVTPVGSTLTLNV